MFKKALLWFLGIVGAIFIVAQFFQPEKNNFPLNDNHLFNHAEVPESVKETLKNACLDCHSNQTSYLWYHKISPVSHLIANHIEEGKEELNLSEWDFLSTIDKISLLNKICEETKNKKMPLKSYTLLHKSAKLTEGQILELCTWAESFGLKIYKSN